MELLTHGVGVCSPDWSVFQEEPAGFSRVYYILSGDVVYRDGQQERPLQQGCLYLFPASRPYRITHDPKRPIECLWLHLDFFPYDVDRLLVLEPQALPTLSHILNALLLESSSDKKRAPLLLSLVEALYYAVLGACPLRQTEAELQRIIEYMRTHFADHDLTVQSLAERFGYSAAHLIRKFRANIHNTPHRHLATLRLAHGAKRLLEGATVSVAASESGYGDVKTFSKAFLKFYGVSPSRYRFYYQPKA
ncbi:MAG: helix-turn-helix transcriptional regulator [Clostridia bacterium]|nr:helix-turn-helix transcriptional regulator [Clostridia bacterium]